MSRDIVITIGVTIVGIGLIYWIYTEIQARRTAAQLAQQAYAQQVLNATGGTGANGNIVGNGLKGADNLATGVCPAVANVVGGAFGVPVAAAGGALPTLCHYSRYLDPVHYIAQYGGDLLNKL